MDTAADNLAHYRSGGGEARQYSDEAIAQHPLLLRGEDPNRSNFEAYTFTGTRALPDGSRAPNPDLANMQEGETRPVRDYFDSRLFQTWDQLPTLLTDLPTYMAFGKTTVQSNALLEATREGDTLTFRGTVAHGFHPNEAFDFHAGQPGAGPAFTLESAGQAQPYRMTYDRRQHVEASARYQPDGSLVLLGTRWGAVE